MKTTHWAVAAGLLFASPLTLPPASAETGLLPPLIPPRAAPEPPPAPECWKPHVQVQPSPVREAPPGEPNFDERYRQIGELHVGAEHPTKAGLRPCSSVLPATGAAGGETATQR